MSVEKHIFQAKLVRDDLDKLVEKLLRDGIELPLLAGILMGMAVDLSKQVGVDLDTALDKVTRAWRAAEALEQGEEPETLPCGYCAHPLAVHTEKGCGACFCGRTRQVITKLYRS